MGTNIDFDVDKILLSPFSLSEFDTPINDPKFHHIYDFLRDPSKTTFEAVSHPFVDDILSSGTVNPVWMPSSTNIPQVDIQYDNSKSKKIQILSNPRKKFRPRTEKESKESSHYIRCEENTSFEYPTIYIPPEWNQQKNVIEVTLVDIDKNPHLYTLENKECKTSTLVFKQNLQHSLYFHVTQQDLMKNQKSFLIEYIKPKQDGIITKDLIKTRQLEQSMLRFTRYYHASDGTYHSDMSSVEYSSIMTEDYGDFSIEDVFPLYGPMCGGQKVCVELKGFLPKDLKTDFIINVVHPETNWFHQIQNDKIKKNRSTFTFSMPPYPNQVMDRAEIMIIIQYKQDIMYQSNYIYSAKIDEELAGDNFNASMATMALTDFSNDLIGALPIYSSIKTEDEVRGVKRARQ